MEIVEIQKQIAKLKECKKRLREIEDNSFNNWKIKKEDKPKVKKLGAWNRYSKQ